MMPRSPRWAGRWVMLILLGAFAFGMAVQWRTGLADNGDFTRSIKFFSSGPVGIRPNFPPRGTDLWHRRFYSDWLPDWTLERHREKVITSAVLLWLPGVWLCKAATLPAVSLPWLSLVPRFLLLGEIWLLLRWAMAQPARRWLTWTLGVPLVLLLTTTDNAAYLNSFYQEAALQVFILPALFSFVWLKSRPTWMRLGLAVGCVALLMTAKSSTIYWPLLALPFGLYAWTARRPDRWHRHPKTIIAAGITLACALTLAARAVTSFREANVHAYHSLFYGALMFSEHPADHLRRLGLVDGADCIGASAYTERGKAYFEAHQDRLNYRDTLSTLANEPAIAWRLGRFGLDSMQDISLEYLGKYAPDDPRGSSRPDGANIGDGSEQRRWNAETESTPANAWANLKFHCFPTGECLALTLLAFAGFCGWQLREPGTVGDLALVGLLTTLAMVADLAVALLGEGRHELIKHLYFANLLFDLALIATLNGTAILLWERATGRKKSSAAQITSAKACLTRMNTA